MFSLPESMGKVKDLPQHYDTDTDLMRILASLGVVIIHCAAPDTFSGVFFNGLARFSVPVFVMISGYPTNTSAVENNRTFKQQHRAKH